MVAGLIATLPPIVAHTRGRRGGMSREHEPTMDAIQEGGLTLGRDPAPVRPLPDGASAFFSASQAARWVARHGVRSQPVPVAQVGECSVPVV
jgi:hypothetical protein